MPTNTAGPSWPGKSRSETARPGNWPARCRTGNCAVALTREYRFADFFLAMSFVNRVAATAVNEDHHPDISISFDRVKLTFSTHKIAGLTRNDFIMAAKSDCIF